MVSSIILSVAVLEPSVALPVDLGLQPSSDP